MAEQGDEAETPRRPDPLPRGPAVTLALVGALVLVAVGVAMNRDQNPVLGPMYVGYLTATGLGLIGLGVLLVARSRRVRWWLGVYTLLISAILIATWVYVLANSDEIWAHSSHGRGSSAPWVAGLLFGALTGVTGVRLLRSPEFTVPSPEQAKAFAQWRVRSQRRRLLAVVVTSGLVVILSVLMLSVAAAAPTPPALISVAGALFVAAAAASMVFHGLWRLRWLPRLSRWGLVVSATVMVAIVIWWVWSGVFAGQQWGWWAVAAGAGLYALATIGWAATRSVPSPSVDDNLTQRVDG